MMRSDELNRHVHGSYAEETAKEIIVHKTLSENQSKDVSKSECNIVHETVSQNNYVDVPDNVIT